jgi:hypothetical protein
MGPHQRAAQQQAAHDRHSGDTGQHLEGSQLIGASPSKEEVSSEVSQAVALRIWTSSFSGGTDACILRRAETTVAIWSDLAGLASRLSADSSAAQLTRNTGLEAGLDCVELVTGKPRWVGEQGFR